MAPQPTKPLQSMAGHSVQAVPMRKSGSVAAMSNPMFKGDPPYTGAWADAAYDPETPGPIYHPGEWLSAQRARAQPGPARTSLRPHVDSPSPHHLLLCLWGAQIKSA